VIPRVAECVGGCADGVRFDPDDPSEPDDWPDVMQLEDRATGARSTYWIRPGRPKKVGWLLVYYFDAE
jgi:hypothetical protein